MVKITCILALASILGGTSTAHASFYSLKRVSESAVDIDPNEGVSDEDFGRLPMFDSDKEHQGNEGALVDENNEVPEDWHRSLGTKASIYSLAFEVSGIQCPASVGVRLRCSSGARLKVLDVRYGGPSFSCSSSGSCTQRSSSSSASNRAQFTWACMKGGYLGKGYSEVVPKGSCRSNNGVIKSLAHGVFLYYWDFGANNWRKRYSCISSQPYNGGCAYAAACGGRDRCPPKYRTIGVRQTSLGSNGIGTVTGLRSSNSSSGFTLPDFLSGTSFFNVTGVSGSLELASDVDNETDDMKLVDPSEAKTSSSSSMITTGVAWTSLATVTVGFLLHPFI